ncbi:twin-arginine translocation pathway signal [Tepidicaulis marinus]|uniref:Twin-arginine translocation pathway signal n=1 Tax=Tepidicaulis marinus TaxID=1333998 RepID=A0A081BA58_9HYPH|nr:porin family protein [Tepidicaulis marinus]GAK44926.1 twin-arginine translocation pathway signal [Tepidicaulis marinus]
MKKQLLKTAALSALLASGMSGAALADAATPGLYVSLGAGMNWLDDVESGGQTTSFDEGFIINGALGYDSGDIAEMGKYRLEAEISWSENDTDTVTAGGVTGNAGGEIEQFGFMVNGYWDFLPGERLRPYVGIGLGLTDLDQTLTVGGLTASADGTEFTYRGALGASYALDANWAIDLGYRYTVVNADNDDAENHSVLTSLRYKF